MAQQAVASRPQLRRRNPEEIQRSAQGAGPGGIVVRTNMFAISASGVSFTHYDAFVRPEGGRPPRPKKGGDGSQTQEDDYPPFKMAHKIMDVLQTETAPAKFTPRGAYDGRRNIFLYQPKVREQEAFKVVMNKATGKAYTVTLTKVGVIDTSVLNDLVRGIVGPQSEIAVTAINAVLRVVPSQKDVLATRRSFFKVHSDVRGLGGGLELSQGWYQSVRPAIGKLVVNIDTANAVMIKAGSLVDVCIDFFLGGGRGQADVRGVLEARRLDDRAVKSLNKFLRGVRLVMSRKHPNYGRLTKGGMRKESVIDKIEMKSAEQYTFNNEHGDRLSVLEYFRKLGTDLMFPSIICIRLRSTHGDVVVPLELYDVIPGQQYKAKLNADATSKMISFTQLKPDQRLRSIREGHQFMGYDQDYVTTTGMSVDSQLQETQAKMLRHPSIAIGGEAMNIRDGSWNMMNRRVLDPGKIKAWGVVLFDPKQRIDSIGKKFMEPLSDALQSMGIPIATAPHYTDRINPQNIFMQLDYFHAEMVEKAMVEIQRNKTPITSISREETLVIAILMLPSNKIRDAFKRWGDILAGVPTQIVVSSKALTKQGKQMNQYCNNLGLKINAKLGGTNCTIDNEWYKSQPTMIIGVDVSHAAPESKWPSVCSMVFTYNYESCSSYMACTEIQEPRKEVIESFGRMFQYAIQRFNQFTVGKKGPLPGGKPYVPFRVIVYRDGVSEGEYEAVFKQEIGAMKSVLGSLGVVDACRITFLVVSKRHHVRFFPMRSDQGDQSGNCRPGLVVDSGIVHPVYDDFYIQSHRGLIGTSRSSRYTLLHDENKMTKDQLQRLSFDLCHVYARSTSSVSIPAPVYYADIACSRSRFHIDPDFLENESVVSGDSEISIEEWQKQFKPVAQKLQKRMYFM